MFFRRRGRRRRRSSACRAPAWLRVRASRTRVRLAGPEGARSCPILNPPRIRGEMEDALLLARAQFGLNIGFHILFPALTIALGWYLVGFRLAYQRTREAAWLATYR